MKVYKFGGASVKDAHGIKNLTRILKHDKSRDFMIVVSAMGKMTNALESVLKSQCEEKIWTEAFEKIKDYHYKICRDLFSPDHDIFVRLQDAFKHLKKRLQQASLSRYDFHYDQVISEGELLSTTIISSYLSASGISNTFLDAREVILTDSNFRSAQVNMPRTSEAILQKVTQQKGVWVTQGFIASDSHGQTTTLGREGSDYSAAIFASALQTTELTIWKDVDGVYNADPKIFKSVKLMEALSYKEAVELAFYGASIIHPKTIRPLREKGIVLKVRSFYDMDHRGSLISNSAVPEIQETSVIVKKKQVLLSLTPKDFTFMDEKNMGIIFNLLSVYHHSINMIQNSAISFSICVDENYAHFESLKKALMEDYALRYNTGQVLITIRHFDEDLINRIESDLKIKMEQKNRSAYQLVIDESEFNDKLKELIERVL